MHRHQTHPSRARRLHAHPHASRKVPFGINYAMIVHEPALADPDALALDDAAPTSPPTPSGSSKQGRGARLPRRAGASRTAGLVPARDEERQPVALFDGRLHP
jgi:hypothetical protein